MAFRFVAVVAALACVNMAAAIYAPAPHCGTALPAIHPIVVHTEIPGPVTIGPQAPAVLEHVSPTQEINYFEKPWIVKHHQSAALNVFTQTPVVVDEYAAPSFHEQPAPPAVVVEAVQGAPVALSAGCSGGYGYGSGYGYGAGYATGLSGCGSSALSYY